MTVSASLLVSQRAKQDAGWQNNVGFFEDGSEVMKVSVSMLVSTVRQLIL